MLSFKKLNNQNTEVIKLNNNTNSSTWDSYVCFQTKKLHHVRNITQRAMERLTLLEHIWVRTLGEADWRRQRVVGVRVVINVS